MAVNFLQALWDYFKTCPQIVDNRFNVTYLPEQPSGANGVEFSIDITPADEMIQQYVRGHGYCQRLFVLQSVNEYGDDVWRNLENSGLFEKIEAWVADNNRKRIFPDLDNFEAEGIYANTPGYIVGAQPGTARYQIQFQLRFYK